MQSDTIKKKKRSTEPNSVKKMSVLRKLSKTVRGRPWSKSETLKTKKNFTKNGKLYKKENPSEINFSHVKNFNLSVEQASKAMAKTKKDDEKRSTTGMMDFLSIDAGSVTCTGDILCLCPKHAQITKPKAYNSPIERIRKRKKNEAQQIQTNINSDESHDSTKQFQNDYSKNMIVSPRRKHTHKESIKNVRNTLEELVVSKEEEVIQDLSLLLYYLGESDDLVYWECFKQLHKIKNMSGASKLEKGKAVKDIFKKYFSNQAIQRIPVDEKMQSAFDKKEFSLSKIYYYICKQIESLETFSIWYRSRRIKMD